MAEFGSALAALKGLKTVLELVGSVLRRTSVLRAERKAGQNPFSINKRGLESSFDETLARLQTVDETWWRNPPAKLAHAYVAPDLFRIQSVQDWLALAQTQDDLKALARAEIAGGSEDDQVRARLSSSFMQATGHNQARGRDAISDCVAILLAGAAERLPPEVQIHSDIEETRHAKTQAMVAEVRESIRNRSGQTVVADVAKDELVLILKRRSIPGVDAFQELTRLLERIERDDLQGAQELSEPELRYWLARLGASSKPPRPADAEKHLQRLRALDPSRDVRIVEAWLIAIQDGFDAAIQHIRDVDNPDARSTLFALLQRKDAELALEWLKEQRSEGASLLTGIGWRNAVVLLAEHGHWKEAAEVLSRLPAAHRIECPDMPFLEGVIHAAMLLPLRWRPYALRGNVFHPDMVRHIREDEGAARHRAKALGCFADAIEHLRQVRAEGRIEAARPWELWLRLSATDAPTRDTARAEIAQMMRDGDRAVRFVELAWAFDIPSELETLRRHLATRERYGGLSEPDLYAKLVLLRWRGPPAELAAFIERELPVLERKASRDGLLGLQVEALANAGEPDRAAALLEAHTAEFDPEGLKQLRDLVRLRRGESVRQSREEHYAADPSLENLLNLVQAIEADRDFASMRPYAEQLFSEAPNVSNATRVVRCLEAAATDEQLLSFLETNDGIVRADSNLTAVKAWALFRLGSLAAAHTLNEKLLWERRGPDDLRLAVNVALQTGEWERLSALVELGWATRDTLPPEMLLLLARVAGESHPDRALDLARHCVDTAPDDPRVLLAAYELAVQLGREGETAHSWLSRAAGLSGERGPVQRFTLRQMIHDMMPAMAERRRAIEQALAENRIPLAAYAAMLHLPLTQIFLGQAERNRQHRDARRRTPLPIRFGASNPSAIAWDSVVSLDVTSLMVLAQLGALQQVVEGFNGVLLPPSTMELLLRERRKVRFHQPSLVTRAMEIRSLIDRGALRMMHEQPIVPPALVAELGQDLARLVEAARRIDGVVVRPFPIHTPGGLGEQEVTFDEPAPPIIDTRRFLAGLLDDGILDHTTATTALPILERLDSGSEHHVDVNFDHPIYLDELTVNYLQTAGLLGRIAGSGLQLYVNPALRAEQQALIEAEDDGRRLAEQLDQVRRLLRDKISDGRVTFLPVQRERDRNGDSESAGLEEGVRTLRELWSDVSRCEAVCVDDRFVTRHTAVTDRNGKTVPIVTAVDLLRSLRLAGRLQDSEWFGMLHGLRECGLVLIPVEADELVNRLRSATVDAEGAIRETHELRIIRQYVGIVRGRDVVKSDEIDFLTRLGLAVVATLRELWKDGSMPTEKVVACSTWLQHFVLPSPIDWMAFGDPGKREEAFADLVVLLVRLISIFVSRQAEYSAWLDREVLAPLAPAAPQLLDHIAARIADYIEVNSEELAHDGA
jgi:hypothetical protein